MFNKVWVREVSFYNCALLDSNCFENREKYTAETSCMLMKNFSSFFFLFCKGVISRERGTAGLSSETKELPVS